MGGWGGHASKQRKEHLAKNKGGMGGQKSSKQTNERGTGDKTQTDRPAFR